MILQPKIMSPHQIRGARIRRSNPITAGIVGAWEPNVFPGGGTLYDRSGYGNNGTMTGATWLADNQHGHAVSLAGGEQDGITCGYGSSLDVDASDEITMIAWIYRDAVGTYPRIFDKFPAPSMYINSSAYEHQMAWYGEIGGVTVDEAESFSAVLPLSTWLMLAMTYAASDNTIRAYVNGATNGTYNGQAGGLSATDTSLWIGNRVAASRGFDGKIGHTSIYNRALTAAEIASLYHDPYQIWETSAVPIVAASMQIPAKMHYYRMMRSA